MAVSVRTAALIAASSLLLSAAALYGAPIADAWAGQPAATGALAFLEWSDASPIGPTWWGLQVVGLALALGVGAVFASRVEQPWFVGLAAVAMTAGAPVLLGLAASGGGAVLAVPLVAWSMWAAVRGGLRGQSIACAGFAELCAPGVGVFTALAAGAIRWRGDRFAWAGVGAVGAVGMFAGALETPDPGVDLATYLSAEHLLWSLPLTAGAAALAMSKARSRVWVGIAAIGAVIALGPTPSLNGEVVVLGGRALPSLAGWLSLIPGPGAGLRWSAASVLCAAALCLGAVHAWPRARPGWMLTVLAFAWMWLGAHPDGLSFTPVARWPRAAAAPGGRVLELPSSTAGRGGSAAAALSWVVLGLDPEARVTDDLAASGMGDPLVGYVLNASAGADIWGLPPDPAGSHLRAAGVRTVVLRRASFSADALASVDPALRAAFGPPARDIAAGVDLYRVGAGALVSETPPLARIGDGGLSSAEWAERYLR